MVHFVGVSVTDDSVLGDLGTGNRQLGNPTVRDVDLMDPWHRLRLSLGSGVVSGCEERAGENLPGHAFQAAAVPRRATSCATAPQIPAETAHPVWLASHHGNRYLNSGHKSGHLSVWNGGAEIWCPSAWIAASVVRIMRSNRVVGLAVVMAGLLSSCSSDQTHLPALLADPMASYEAEGIVLIDASEQAERPGFLGGKPTHAQVRRIFRIPDQSQAKIILSDAAKFAQSEGWRLTPSIGSTTTGYGGAKKLAPGDGRLSLSLMPLDPLHDLDGPRVLRIFMDFGSVRFDDTTTSPPGG